MPTSVRTLDIQGHRGARGLLPENTLPAFAKALSVGVTTLELDCGMTRDGVVVVSHDSVLNPDITRAPDGRWLARAGPAIWDLTYDELMQYDVGRIQPGTAYAARFPRQESVDGTRVPRLADLFALVRQSGNDTVRFNIETKVSPLHPSRTAPPDTLARAIMSLIKQEKLDRRAMIQSFDWRALAIVQAEEPGIATVYLTARTGVMDNLQAAGTESPWMPGRHIRMYDGSIPRMIRAAGGAAWSPSYDEVTRADIDEAHEQGLKVIVWTVNSERDMRRMVTLGVDGIISDYPDLLLDTARGNANGTGRH